MVTTAHFTLTDVIIIIIYCESTKLSLLTKLYYCTTYVWNSVEGYYFASVYDTTMWWEALEGLSGQIRKAWGRNWAGWAKKDARRQFFCISCLLETRDFLRSFRHWNVWTLQNREGIRHFLYCYSTKICHKNNIRQDEEVKRGSHYVFTPS